MSHLGAPGLGPLPPGFSCFGSRASLVPVCQPCLSVFFALEDSADTLPPCFPHLPFVSSQQWGVRYDGYLKHPPGPPRSCSPDPPPLPGPKSRVQILLTARAHPHPHPHPPFLETQPQTLSLNPNPIFLAFLPYQVPLEPSLLFTRLNSHHPRSDLYVSFRLSRRGLASAEYVLAGSQDCLCDSRILLLC